MIKPTLKNRIHALDVIRGAAILGILLANIPSFAGPALSAELSGTREELGLVDSWIEALTLAFVTGKFRSSLAILFGVGLFLQFRKRSTFEGNWPRGYLKRMGFLALIGLFHGLFVWYGDILFMYAVVGLVAAFVVRLDPVALRAIVGVKAVLAALIALGLAAVGVFMALGAPEGVQGGLMFWFTDPAYETQVFAHGTYLQQLGLRSIYFGLMIGLGLFTIFPFLLGLFMLGILFGRSGVLAAPSQHPKTRNAALALGLGLGLPLNLLALLLIPIEGVGARDVYAAWEIFFGPLLAVGYVMLGAVLVEKGALRLLTGVLAKVGRVALSVYLMQSLLATTIFYSWGFGLFGELDRLQSLYVVVAIWIVNVAFAYAWLSRYSIGPVEWVWRSMTEGRKVPWRSEREADTIAAPPPPPVVRV
jgi:uncharacterized protein